MIRPHSQSPPEFSVYSIFIKTTNKNELIRRIGISFGNVVDEKYKTIDLFTNLDEEKKEENLQRAIIKVKAKHGKNSILKGMNLEEKATTIKRNKLIGGHNGE